LWANKYQQQQKNSTAVRAADQQAAFCVSKEDRLKAVAFNAQDHFRTGKLVDEAACQVAVCSC
jgi:hypothetical protein